ncbi:hypothetical protein H072_9011 [Dactylellina haptotyla CBS 200.50]|uniref:UspA domain-containing protein n=1 Tax=Dactylellina haptotyla (strain CBS 200.50) TaxID=1284197 RepID=S8A8A1_DACHA|nr:hypothetical protein H072_9011 [Dactylellina haptotyla CBS 200.50]
MSLESALEEERLEILKLLERPSLSNKPNIAGNASSSSPTTPRSPPLVPRAISPARSPPRSNQSIGGISSMILAAERGSNSTSPPPSSLSYNTRSRDSSPHGSLHSTTSSGYGGPRLLKDRERDASAFTPNADYQFSMLPSTPNPHFRRTGGGRSGKAPSNLPASPTSSPTLQHAGLSQGYQDTLSSIYSESGPFQPGGMGLPSGSQVSGRQIRLGSSSRRSGSPSMYHTRSASPSTGNLSLSPLSSPPLNMNMSIPARTLVTENDTLIDLESAYRRLSDDALRNSGGSLANLPERGGTANHIRASSGESISRDGGVRLEKDLTFVVGYDGREIAVESSEESDYSSEDDAESFRGRRAEKQIVGVANTPETKDTPPNANGTNPPIVTSTRALGQQRKTMSLLAAAEEERKTVSSRYKVSSLLPSVTVSPPTQTQQNTNRNIIHPNTNFDTRSHLSTPFSSDAEADSKDIKRASRLTMSISPVISNPETHRVARTIIRGDATGIQSDPGSGRRKQRSYLVATDLSAEAAHALEWTIGTVLRDGDMLLAIYAIDEENAGDFDAHKVMTPTTEQTIIGNNPIPPNRRKSLEKGRVTKIGNSPARSPSLTRSEVPDNAGDSTRYSSNNSSRDNLTQFPAEIFADDDGKLNLTSDTLDANHRDKSKAEQERWAATEQISALVTKLLKKTKLQITVIVEVIHCKSPKHLLTEMIDILEPTLVILGSRGRSALKGVLLGSFSNYLVTKSSVPVMVARKKLKKSKYKNPHPRLINNLAAGASRTLAFAKVD